MWLRISESLNKVRQKADEGAGAAITALSRARDALFSIGGIEHEFAATYDGCSAEELAGLLTSQALSVQTPAELLRTVHVWRKFVEHSDFPDAICFPSSDFEALRGSSSRKAEEKAVDAEATSKLQLSVFAAQLEAERQILKNLGLPAELLGPRFGFAEIFLSSSALLELLTTLLRSECLRNVIAAACVCLESPRVTSNSEECAFERKDSESQGEGEGDGEGEELQRLLKDLLRLLEVGLGLRKSHGLALLKALAKTAASDEALREEVASLTRKEEYSGRSSSPNIINESETSQLPSDSDAAALRGEPNALSDECQRAALEVGEDYKDNNKEAQTPSSEQDLSSPASERDIFKAFEDEVSLNFHTLINTVAALQRPWKLRRLEAQIEILSTDTASLSRKIETWPLPVADESDADEFVVAQNLRLRASTRVLQQECLLQKLRLQAQELWHQTAETVVKVSENWKSQRNQRCSKWESHQHMAEAVVRDAEAAQQKLLVGSKDLTRQALLLEERREDVLQKLKAKEAERERLEAQLEECKAQIRSLRKAQASVHAAEERLHGQIHQSQADERRRQERLFKSQELWREAKESLFRAEVALEEAALKETEFAGFTARASTRQTQVLERIADDFQTLVYRHYAFEKTRLQQQAAALLQRMRLWEQEMQCPQLGPDEMKELREGMVKSLRRFKAAHSEAETFLRMYTPALQAAIRQQLHQVKQKHLLQDQSSSDNTQTQGASSEDPELKQIELEAEAAAQTPQREITSLYSRTIQQLGPFIASLNDNRPPPPSVPPVQTPRQFVVTSEFATPAEERSGVCPVTEVAAFSGEKDPDIADFLKRPSDGPLVVSVDEGSGPPSPKHETANDEALQEVPEHSSAKVIDEWYEEGSL